MCDAASGDNGGFFFFCFMACRSSLQHAADAEEARAMDDMIGRMEGMFAAPAVEPTPTPAPAAPATSAEAAPAIAPFGIAPLSAAVSRN